MAGETVITVVGNLTADPELRTTSSGASVCSFTIAATPRTYNRQTGQFEDGQALFMRCSAWRDLANHCAQSLSKGMRVIAQGRLQQRSYQAQDGSNRTVFEMQVDETARRCATPPRRSTAPAARRPGRSTAIRQRNRPPPTPVPAVGASNRNSPSKHPSRNRRWGTHGASRRPPPRMTTNRNSKEKQ